MDSKKKFIDLEKLISSKNPKLLKWLPKFILNYLKRIIHQDEINNFIDRNGHTYNVEFCEAVVRDFKIHVKLHGIENIPKEGKVVLAMNHPLGGMDAMALVAGLKDHRQDIQFIVNDILLNLENLKDLFVGINKHGRNGATMKEQLHDLFSTNKCICIFPAGLVSRKIDGKIIDLEWKKSFVQLSKKYEQQIIPIYIDGKLSNFFYRLANFRKFIGIKANIEMLYLSDEMFRLKNKKLDIYIGKPISISDFNKTYSDREIAQQIKAEVYALKN